VFRITRNLQAGEFDQSLS